MSHVFLADGLAKERAALRLMLLDLKMNLVGEANDWPTTLLQAPTSKLDMLLIEWSLLPPNPGVALAKLRLACPNTIIVVLISHFDPRQQAAQSIGAEVFISKGETPDRIAERLQAAADRTSPMTTPLIMLAPKPI